MTNVCRWRLKEVETPKFISVQLDQDCLNVSNVVDSFENALFLFILLAKWSKPSSLAVIQLALTLIDNATVVLRLVV